MLSFFFNLSARKHIYYILRLFITGNWSTLPFSFRICQQGSIFIIICSVVLYLLLCMYYPSNVEKVIGHITFSLSLSIHPSIH